MVFLNAPKSQLCHPDWVLEIWKIVVPSIQWTCLKSFFFDYDAEIENESTCLLPNILFQHLYAWNLSMSSTQQEHGIHIKRNWIKLSIPNPIPIGNSHNINVFLRPSLSGNSRYNKLLGTAGIIVNKKLKWGVPENFVPMYKVPP